MIPPVFHHNLTYDTAVIGEAVKLTFDLIVHEK